MKCCRICSFLDILGVHSLRSKVTLKTLTCIVSVRSFAHGVKFRLMVEGEEEETVSTSTLSSLSLSPALEDSTSTSLSA